MSILQIFNDMSVSDIVGSGSGVIALLSIILNKIFSNKADKADIVQKQLSTVWETVDHLDKVVKELQEKSCYRENCKIRLNGDDQKKQTK